MITESPPAESESTVIFSIAKTTEIRPRTSSGIEGTTEPDAAQRLGPIPLGAGAELGAGACAVRGGARAQAAGPWPPVRGAAGCRRPEAARRRHGAWRSRSAAVGRPTAAVAVRRRAPPRARGATPAARGGRGGGDHHPPPAQVIPSHAHGPAAFLRAAPPPRCCACGLCGTGGGRAERVRAGPPGPAAAGFAAAPPAGTGPGTPRTGPGRAYIRGELCGAALLCTASDFCSGSQSRICDGDGQCRPSAPGHGLGNVEKGRKVGFVRDV